MSDYDRGKYYNKKKYNSNRDRLDRNDPKPSSSRYNANKTLYKAEKDNKEGNEAKEEVKIKQPQILIKVREKTEEPIMSPKHSKEKEEVSKEAPIGSSTDVGQLFHSAKKMLKSVKLLEDGIIYNENVQEFLNDANDFIVVGIIGSQRVGKSTIANLLASESFTSVSTNTKETNKTAEKVTMRKLSNAFSKCSIDDGKRLIFKQETEEICENALHTSSGIDMFITEDRMIILDCQPFLSASVYDEIMHNDLKRSNFMSEFSTIDHMGEILGLQHIAFLMSVCHVLIFVQDYFFDINHIRYLTTAEMIKPTISNNEEEYLDPLPHLLILQNKAQMEDFTPQRFRVMQNLYRQVLTSTKMHTESGMGLGNGKIIPALNPQTCGDSLNLFLLPNFDNIDDYGYKGHPPIGDLLRTFKMHVQCVTKYPLSHVQLSEKNWLQYCFKVWEHIKKSPFYVEYAKLLP